MLEYKVKDMGEGAERRGNKIAGDERNEVEEEESW